MEKNYDEYSPEDTPASRGDKLKTRAIQITSAAVLALSLACVGAKDFIVDGYYNWRGSQISTRDIPWIGVYLPNFGDLTTIRNFEKDVDAPMDIISWYEKWNKPISEQKLSETCNSGHIPQITWESWSGAGVNDETYKLDEIASGKHDEFIQSELTKITQICKGEVFIRFDHEMNSIPGKRYWYPWQGDPKAYTAAWRHIVDMGRKISPNLKWVWCPVHLDDTEKYDVENYWPGDEYVDYTALTLLNFWQATPKPDYEFTWRSFRELYRPQRGRLLSFAKPVIIAEVATGEGVDSNGRYSKAEWIRDMFKYLPPEIDGVVWFNNEQAREHPDMKWTLDSSPEAKKAFSDSIKNIRQKP